MEERALYEVLVHGMFWAAAAIFGVLLWVTAPYGRHTVKGWGALVSTRWGWRIMEAPAALVIGVCALDRGPAVGASTWLLLLLWESHYLYRAFVYPNRRRDGDDRMPWMIVVMGLLFNGINAYLNGRWLFHFSAGYGTSWWTSPLTWLGLLLFCGGLCINRRADEQLRALRAENEVRYVLPQEGLFRWIDCPNYFGELMQWIGWALLCGSAAGWAFAAWTAANLVPRARSHHRWYRERFADYPQERKALLPHIW